MLDKIMKHKEQGKTIGITFSCFDLLHAGHCAMLSEARAYCDILIVGLQTDPTIDRPEKNKPVQTVFERWVQLQALKDVDYIIPYATEQELVDLLLMIRPDFRIIGSEYKGKNFTGCDIEDIKVIYNRRDHSFSSSSLRKRIFEAEESKRKQ